MTERASTDALMWARRLAGLVATAALLAAAITGVLLAQRYHPGGPGPSWLLHRTALASRRLVSRHEQAMGIAVAATSIWGVLTLATLQPGRRRAVGACVGLSVVLALAASLSWRLVQWDQLALRTVTVGDDIAGLWYGAFSREVLFVSVGGSEMSQGTYAVWVVVHLVAPVLALLAMAIALLSDRRPSHELATGAAVDASLTEPPSTGSSGAWRR